MLEGCGEGKVFPPSLSRRSGGLVVFSWASFIDGGENMASVFEF